eukprot:SRR837773.20723.p2 GENE.SRR837773.20723~~SRR837773.20723.p2  ORF type:complete len:421 (+),score=154.76 SRR837773.20723:116-1264(+)
MIFHTRDSQDGLPNGYHLEQHTASHWIIEELMLLANRCVAKHLAQSLLSEVAVLRNHEGPDLKKAETLTKMMKENLGLDWNPANAGSLYRSCQAIYRDYGEELGLCVEYMVMKSGMQQARYFVYTEESCAHHFALNFDYYTHFTSPIRRYPDVMVHRVLAALLTLGEPATEAKPYQEQEEANLQVTGCNEKRLACRKTSMQIDRAVFCIYLRSLKSWFYTVGTVLAFHQDNSSNENSQPNDAITVYCPQLGKESKARLRAGDGGVAALEDLGLFVNGVEDRLMLPDNWRFTSRGMVELEWLPEDGDKSRRKRQVLQMMSCVPIVIIPTNSVPVDYETFFVSPFHAKGEELAGKVPDKAKTGFEWHEADEDGVDVVYDGQAPA